MKMENYTIRLHKREECIRLIDKFYKEYNEAEHRLINTLVRLNEIEIALNELNIGDAKNTINVIKQQIQETLDKIENTYKTGD